MLPLPMFILPVGTAAEYSCAVGTGETLVTRQDSSSTASSKGTMDGTRTTTRRQGRLLALLSSNSRFEEHRGTGNFMAGYFMSCLHVLKKRGKHQPRAGR